MDFYLQTARHTKLILAVCEYHIVSIAWHLLWKDIAQGMSMDEECSSGGEGEGRRLRESVCAPVAILQKAQSAQDSNVSVQKPEGMAQTDLLSS